MMPAEKGLERRVKVDCCAKARTPMMMPEVAHRADRIMKARVAFQYAVGTHHSHSWATLGSLCLVFLHVSDSALLWTQHAHPPKAQLSQPLLESVVLILGTLLTLCSGF